MKQVTLPDFMIIDDDPVNNVIASKIIQLNIAGATIETFTEPENALDYIRATYSGNDAKNAVVFLDINMPSLTGWQVLDVFKDFPDPVKEHVKIFMLSSSISFSDKEKAIDCSDVWGYVEKNLSQSKLQMLFPDYVNQA